MECSNFTSKNVVYVVHVLGKRSNVFKDTNYSYSSLCECRQNMVNFEPRTFRSTSDDVVQKVTTTLDVSSGNLDYMQEIFFAETSKIRRNSGNPEKLKFSFSEFRKNRSDSFTKSILDRLGKIIKSIFGSIPIVESKFVQRRENRRHS